MLRILKNVLWATLRGFDKVLDYCDPMDYANRF